MAKFEGFGKDLPKFLAELEKNNRKAWFDANKERYEESVLEPARAFVRAMEPRLRRISKHIVASDKKAGGSLMRIYRDTRFGKDKRPYNEHVSMVFWHDAGKKVAAPGFYLRITSKGATGGTGLWHPDTKFVGSVRDHIVDNPKAWTRARNEAVKALGPLAGESLKRPPRGYDPEHPLVEDLKRKDFVAFADMPKKTLLAANFPDELAKRYRESKKLVKFLCDALDLDF